MLDDDLLTRSLRTIWDKLIVEKGGTWGFGQSVHETAAAFRGRSIDDFIRWQISKAGMAGFLAGLPGLVVAGVTIPTNLLVTSFIQMRMVAVMALHAGRDIDSEETERIMLWSLLGVAAGSVAVGTAKNLAVAGAAQAVTAVQAKALMTLKHKVASRLFAKAGTAGVLNLGKLVPLIGGLVGGGVDMYTTWQIAKLAKRHLSDGVPEILGEAVEITPDAFEPAAGAQRTLT